jgi:hypothetical protein
VYLEAEVRLDLLDVLNLVRVQLHHTVDDALHATQFLFEVVVGHLVAVALGDGVFQLVFQVLAFLCSGAKTYNRSQMRV